MNGIVIEQIEHQKRVKGTKIDKRRRKKKQYERMDKREEKEKEEIGDLRMREWRRNNIIMKGVNKFGKNEIEQEIKEFIKEIWI